MDSFEIEFKRSAEKDLRRIKSSSVREILKRIEALTENPFPRQSQKPKKRRSFTPAPTKA